MGVGGSRRVGGERGGSGREVGGWEWEGGRRVGGKRGGER